MFNIKTLILLVLILHAVIVFPAGHGIGFLIFAEVFWLPGFFGIGTEEFSFRITDPVSQNIGFIALLSLTGQLVLLGSVLLSNSKSTVFIQFIGLAFLWTAYTYLSIDLFTNNQPSISFVTGLPFFVASLSLTFKLIRQWVGFSRKSSVEHT
ncbi:MAG TPA: hypothetical protein PKD93_00215 [Ferruginibacter sp.]|nr:hypothetical protein [Ferruginibacter sp.]HNK29082.1 hypothetical protein [Ferruginibacter sp.]HNO99087.1 hypothetical protein [Ferruginibacter sp.]